MNLTIELSDEQAVALRAQAEAQGLTLEQWLRQLAEQHLKLASIAHLQRADPKEWARQFRAWANGHDPNGPVLSAEAMSRESIYPDRS
jgi:hypothetical protein